MFAACDPKCGRDRVPFLTGPFLLTRRPHWLISVCVGAAGAWWLSQAGYDNPNIYDEGVSVYAATRVLAGDIPYRDFWIVYPPGIFYVLAGVFKLFGPSLLVERHVSVLLNATAAAMSFAIVAPAAGSVRAGWCAAVLLLWLTRLGIFASTVVAAIVLSLAAVMFVRRYVASHRSRDLVVAALLTSATGLFRQDFAVYACVAIVAGLAALQWLVPADRPVGRVPPPLLYAGVTILGGTGLVLTIFAVAGAGPAIEQLIVLPVFVLPRFRDLPYPDHLVIYTPLIMSAIAVGLGVRTIRRGAAAEGTTIVILGLCGLLLLNYSRVRSDLFHIFPAFAFGLTGFVSAIAQGVSVRRAAFGIAVFAATAVSITASTLAALPPPPPAAPHAFALARAKGIRSAADPATYEAVVTAVQGLTRPGDRIFVGNDRHDRLFINDVLFYFLADRHSATKYHDLHPGIATTDAVQREMIREIEDRRVAVVVIRTERHPLEYGNESSRSSGVTLLDAFLRERFRTVERLGDYEIRIRR